jgi:hypothetical protein
MSMFGERTLDDRMDQGVLGAEVVIDRSDIRSGGTCDLPERKLQIVALNQELLDGFDQARGGPPTVWLVRPGQGMRGGCGLREGPAAAPASCSGISWRPGPPQG